MWQRTFTDSEPARIFPHETASSGRAPESEPSNSWPVFYTANSISEGSRRVEAYDVHRVVGTVTLVSLSGTTFLGGR